MIQLSKFTKTTKFFKSNFVHFTNQTEMRKFLDDERPFLYVALINSTWNPLCSQALKDLDQIKNEFPDIQLVVGNEDEDTRFGQYYDIKATPQFNIALHGRVVSTQVGSNTQNLKNKIKRVLELRGRNMDSDLDYYIPHDMQLRTELEQTLVSGGVDIENDHFQFILRKLFIIIHRFFKIWGLGFGVWGLGFGVWGLGFGVWAVLL